MGFQTSTLEVAIGAAASLSAEIHLAGQRLFAIVVPAGWDAADITFQGAVSGGTFFDVYDEDDAEVVVEAAASRYILLNPAKFIGLQRLKIRSGTTGAPVNQTDAVTLALVLVD